MFIEFIENKAKHNKYTKIYLSLINKAMNREAIGGGTENHHIVPKCFKKEWSKSKNNLVTLTYREHFVAHLLLTKMFYGVYEHKMVYALGMLCGNKNIKRTNSNIYRRLKKAYSELNTMKTPDAKRKVSEALRGRTKKSHQYILDSAIKKSITMLSPESNYQKIHVPNTKKRNAAMTQEERKLKFGHPCSEENKLKQSIERKGKTAENCERVAKMKNTKLEINKTLSKEEKLIKFGHSKGKHWYHNDEFRLSKTFHENCAPPGWVLGRGHYEKN